MGKHCSQLSPMPRLQLPPVAMVVARGTSVPSTAFGTAAGCSKKRGERRRKKEDERGCNHGGVNATSMAGGDFDLPSYIHGRRRAAHALQRRRREMRALWGRDLREVEESREDSVGGPVSYVSPGGWLGRSARGRVRPKVRPARRAQTFSIKKDPVAY